MSRQPDFATTPRPSRARNWERAAGALGVLAAGFVAVAATGTRREATEAAARLAETRREISEQSARLRQLRTRTASSAGPASASAPARVVAAIAAVLPAEARLEALTIDYARGTSLEMHVLARDAAAWDRLLERLDRSPDFEEVEPGPESRRAQVQTVIRARWARGAR